MAKARKILKRTKAVKTIRTVTKTMEMISTARFKKTHDRLAASRPYALHLGQIVVDVLRAARKEGLGHPLLAAPAEANRHVLLVLTSNRGLAGAYNASILRLAMGRIEELRRGGRDLTLDVVGKRGIQAFRFRGYPLNNTYTQFEQMPLFAQVAPIADALMDAFTAKKIAGVDVAYMKFVSSGVQKPTLLPLLPMAELAQPRAAEAEIVEAVYEFLPSPAEIFAHLLPAMVRVQLYHCFLDAAVSEQVARIAAMKAATENADEMIHSLTIRYNRTRQAQITTELSEIMGGRMALQ